MDFRLKAKNAVFPLCAKIGSPIGRRLRLVVVFAWIGLTSGCGLQIRSISIANLGLGEPQASFFTQSLSGGGHYSILKGGDGEDEYKRHMAGYFGVPYYVRVGDEVMVIGGGAREILPDGNGAFSAVDRGAFRTEMLRLSDRTVREGPRLPYDVSGIGHVAQANDGEIYLFGINRESGGNHPTSASFRFDSQKRVWEGIAPLPQPHELGSSSISFDVGAGKIVLVVLRSAGSEIYEYDRIADSWSVKGSLDPAFPRLNDAVMASDGRIAIHSLAPYASGTPHSGALSFYEPSSGALSAPVPLPEPRFSSAIIAGSGGKVLFVGGSVNAVQGSDTPFMNGAVQFLATSIAYDPVSSVWSSGPSLPFPFFFPNAIRLENGNALVFSAAISVEYDPSSDSFAPVKNASYAYERWNASQGTRIWGQGFLRLDGGKVLRHRLGGGMDFYDGDWSPFAFAAADGAVYQRMVGLSQDGKIALLAPSSNSTGSPFYFIDRETREFTAFSGVADPSMAGSLGIAEFATVRVSDDLFLALNEVGMGADGYYAREGSRKVVRIRLSDRSAVATADRNHPARGSAYYAFADRYLLVHSGYTIDSGAQKVYSDFEFYDSQADAWKSIGRPPHARREAAVAYDPSRNSLYFFGGYTSDTTSTYNTAQVDVYDIASEAWSSVPVTTTSRYGGAAYALGSGRFLVFGGVPMGNEIYDVDAGTRTSVGAAPSSLSTSSRSAILGIYGGHVFPLSDGRLLFPVSNGVSNVSLRLYEPQSGVWSEIAVSSAISFALAFAGGEVLLTRVGGLSHQVHRFDPGSSVLVELPDPGGVPPPASPSIGIDRVVPIFAHPLGSGKMLLIGSFLSDGSSSLDSYIYDVKEDRLTQVDPFPMVSPVVRLVGSVSPSGRAAFVSNADMLFGPPAEIFYFDASDGTWSGPVPAPHPTLQLRSIAPSTDGKIYLVGGVDLGTMAHSDAVDVIDAETRIVSSGPALPREVLGSGAGVFHDGTLFVAGGADLLSSTLYSEGYALAPGASSWSAPVPLPHGFALGLSHVGVDGSLYLLGGSDATLSAPMSTVIRIDSGSFSVTTLASLPSDFASLVNFQTRSMFNVFSGPSGRLQIFGKGAMNISVSLLPGVSTWEERSPGFNLDVIGELAPGAAVIWSKKSSSGGAIESTVRIHSEYPATPFLLRGGTAPYGIEADPSGGSIVFRKLGLFLPLRPGEHRIVGRDASGAGIRSEALLAN